MSHNLILNFIYISGTETCSWNQMWTDGGISYTTDFPITVNEIGTITCSDGTEIQLKCTGPDEFDKNPVAECDTGIVELVMRLWSSFSRKQKFIIFTQNYKIT